MKKEYDFVKAKRGPVVSPATGKTRVTIRLDNESLDCFEIKSSPQAREPLERTIRSVIREELRRAG